MKSKTTKLIAIATIAVTLLSATPSFARTYRVGDVIGYALKTDIAATINGYGIPSYNVDGYTYIVAEDLRNYGFSVSFDDSTRTLFILRDYSKETVTQNYVKPEVLPHQVGQREYPILYTDIITYIDDIYIPSYNIDGQTIIRFDALNAYGKVSYDNSIREISIVIQQLGFNVVDTEEVSVLENMSVEERREVNLFLSNFSEAYYEPQSPYSGGVEEEMIGFAARHIMLNGGGRGFEYTNDGYMGVYADDANKVLNRFFGKTLPSTTPNDSKEWFYRDGKYLRTAGDGETYAFFSIADGMYMNADGTYTVDFTIYFDTEERPGSTISDKSVYSLTPQQAKSNNKFSVSKRGIAIIKAKTYGGEETYELVEYYLLNS